MDHETTIVAVSSPSGRSTHALIRATGPHAWLGTKQLGLKFEPRRIIASRISFKSEEIPVLISAFPANSSFTGQETIEIQVVNNPFVVDFVMNELINATNGRFAEAGEFTARSFLNGNISISAAEGVCATISAGNDAELLGATLLRKGALASATEPISLEIIRVLALVEAGIDFTDEEEVVAISKDDLRTSVEHCIHLLNAILENKGARIALVATRGFRDVLELRRSARVDLYDLYQDAPAVLAPRHCRLEVTERLDASGAVVTPLDESDIDPIIEFVKNNDIEAVAVSLLYSFLNDAHERIVGDRLRAALPGVPVFLSSEVLPEIREYERTSTTAVCAYVGPILESYLHRLEEAVSGMGLPKLYVMGSSGGVFDVAEGLKMPAMAIESGPAAGVIAAQLIGRQLKKPNLISFDMGGTTAKASLIKDGQVETTSEYEVGGGDGNVNRWMNGAGHPIRVPVIDLAEVSAGGGSIAWIDPVGALRVGPKSAGAAPGRDS